MNNVELGKLIDTPQERDAIHVAVIPMRAADELSPGQRVRVVDGAAWPATKTAIGIVDPYLTRNIPRGATFWLCLLPNTVTGMRHHWSHPTFANQSDMGASEIWLRGSSGESYRLTRIAYPSG